MGNKKTDHEEPLPAKNDRYLERENKVLREKLTRTVPLLERGKKAEVELQMARATLEKINNPPLIYGTLLRVEENGARVVYSGHNSQILAPLSSDVDPKNLTPGCEVLLDQKSGYVIEVVGPQKTGIAAIVKDILPDGRLIVTTAAGSDGKVVHAAAGYVPRIGFPVLLDASASVAIRALPRDDRKDLYVEEIPTIGWDDIGGLEAEKEKLRAMIEHPYLYPEYYRQYKTLRPSKGVLLHGPPGCGKTLLIKALVHEMFKLRQVGMPIPVIVVWDEAEALFHTRGTGMHIEGGSGGSMSDTVVPQLLAQLDGLNALNSYTRETCSDCENTKPFFYYIGGPQILNQFVGNTEEAIREVYESARERSNFVATILLTNRPDMLDPALIREGRIDKKLYIPRPDKASAKNIFSVYLRENDFPIHASELHQHTQEQWIENATGQILNYIFNLRDPIALVEYRDGRKKDLYRSDLLSGSKVYAIVQRACESAIAEQIKTGEAGLKIAHLQKAVEASYDEEVDILTSGSPQKWSQILGKESDLIARISVAQKYSIDELHAIQNYAKRSGVV